MIRLSLRGGPLHAALAPVPLAFLWAAFGFDFAGWRLDRPGLWVTGYHLTALGVALALLLALPGLVDFLRAGRGSPGRRRAAWHASVNALALALYAVAWWVRGHPEVPAEPGTVLIAGIGAGLLVVGAWLGGGAARRIAPDAGSVAG